MTDTKKQKIVEEVREILNEDGAFTVDCVYDHCEPHPYTIGPKHVAFAADHHSGILGEYAIEQMEKIHGPSCVHPGCRLRKHEHKTSHILMLKLTRDLTNKEAAQALTKLKSLAEREGIEGFGFPNLNKEYTIAEPIEEEVP